MAILQTLVEGIGNSTLLQLMITIGALLAWPIAAVVYNLHFHPLSKFPGPSLWAATYLPYIRALLDGKLIHRLADIHHRYGDVVRIGPNELSFATEDAWRDIYDYRPGHKETLKDPTWYIAPNNAPQNILTTRDPKAHARMRKYLGNSFTDTAFRSQQPIVEGYADLLVSRLRDLASAPECQEKGALADMTDWINFFTVDVIGDLAFGESFGCLEKSDFHPWVQTLFRFLIGMVYAASMRFYPWTQAAIGILMPKRLREIQQRHTDFANEKINRRLNLDTDRPDFITPFLKHNPDFMYMSKGEIESTFAIVIIAGSETTATVLCGVINHLTRFPEKLAQLEECIRERFASDDEICIETANNIPYLDAVINEGLRLCNPVPGGLPRTVPSGGDVYYGHFLPGGTKLSVRPWILCRSSRYFALATEFHPERWLPIEQRPCQFHNDRLTAIKPFSTGPSGCLGRPLAWAEMRLILARLVWTFDMSVDQERQLDWSKLRAMMTVEKQPMPIRLRLSNRSQYKVQF